MARYAITLEGGGADQAAIEAAFRALVDALDDATEPDGWQAAGHVTGSTEDAMAFTVTAEARRAEREAETEDATP